MTKLLGWWAAMGWRSGPADVALQEKQVLRFAHEDNLNNAKGPDDMSRSLFGSKARGD
jgi:hypothetical protein